MYIPSFKDFVLIIFPEDSITFLPLISYIIIFSNCLFGNNEIDSSKGFGKTSTSKLLLFSIDVRSFELAIKFTE